MGDGKSINIWEDNWIPNYPHIKPDRTRAVLSSPQRVYDLIDHLRLGWKKQAIEQLFPPHVTAQILQIPIHQGGRQD